MSELENEDTYREPEQIAGDIAAGRSQDPIRLDIAELRQVTDALSAEQGACRLDVILFGGYAVASFPELSSQQIVVAKPFGRRLRPSDFEFAADVKLMGDVGRAPSFARFAFAALARHGWWFVTGWTALSWLVIVLGDYVFANQLAELALSGSVISFVLVKLLWHVRLSSEQRDRLVASGAWQQLAAGQRNLGRLLGSAACLSLLAVLFSHSTMTALEARGYITPVTGASARVLLVSAMTGGSVMLLALGLATISDLQARMNGMLVEKEAASSLLGASGARDEEDR